jgi:hypothetical protein
MTSITSPASLFDRCIARIARALRPVAHEWLESGDQVDERRTCTVCGRVEEFDIGGGHAGSSWEYIKKGDSKAHDND